MLGEDIGGTEKLPAEKPKVEAKQDLFSDPDLFSTANDNTEIQEQITNFKTINDVEHTYELADTAEKIETLVSLLEQCEEFCFDSETTSLDTISAELVGLSFSVKPHHAYYVPVSENKEQALKQLQPFRKIFDNTSKVLIGQNIKYDYQILLNYGIEIKNKLFDTMVAHFFNYAGYAPWYGSVSANLPELFTGEHFRINWKKGKTN